MAGNRPAALCSAMVACCWLLQKSPVESRASKGMLVWATFEAAEAHGQHHLVTGKCDRIKFIQKLFHKRQNTAPLYHMEQHC